MLKHVECFVCFFQVHVNGDYECLNKYDGRGLSDATFKTTLDKFLQPGNKVSLIDTLASKLIKLKTVLQTLDSYRFHTCSLLVTYDAGTYLNEISSLAFFLFHAFWPVAISLITLATMQQGMSPNITLSSQMVQRTSFPNFTSNAALAQ